MIQKDQILILNIELSTISIYVWRKGRIEKVQLQQHESDFICAIYCNNQIVFGEDAILKAKNNTKYLFTNLAMILGLTYQDPIIQRLKNNEGYQIGNQNCVLVEIDENGMKFVKEPLKLFAMIVNHVIDIAKSHLESNDIRHLVILYPASYKELQVNALKDIASLTYIPHYDVIPETDLTYLTYNLSPVDNYLSIHCEKNHCYAVIVKKHYDEYKEIYRINRDYQRKNEYLNALKDYVSEKFKKLNYNLQSMKKSGMKRFNYELEMIQYELTNGNATQAWIEVDDYKVLLTKEELYSVFYKLNEGICRELKKMINQASVTPTGLVLTGKDMRLFGIDNSICRFFGLKEQPFNKERAVTYGLISQLDGFIERHCNDCCCNKRVDDDDNEVGNDNSDGGNDDSDSGNDDSDGGNDNEVGKDNVVGNDDEDDDDNHEVGKDNDNVVGNNNDNIEIGDNHTHNNENSSNNINDDSFNDDSDGIEIVNNDQMNEEKPVYINEIIPPVTDNQIIDNASLPPEPCVVEIIPSPYQEDETDNNPENTSNHQNSIYTLRESQIPQVEIQPIQPVVIINRLLHNISISTNTRPDGTNLNVLAKRNQELPFTTTTELKIIKNKPFKFSLFEGDASKKSKCRKIRKIELQRDLQHPSKDDHYFYLTIQIDEDRSINLSYEWNDHTPINVVSDVIL